MYLKERLLISLNPQKFFLARTNAKSHSFFIWVMFTLTIFWVRENSIFLFRTNSDELFVELSTTSSLTYAFCLSSTALVPFANSNITVMCHLVISGTDKYQKIAFLFAKLCCFH